MAVMLNMIPIEPKQMPVIKNANNKSGNNRDTSLGTNFAKTLDMETDRSGMDVDSKVKNDDNAQLMVAMASMVPPMIINTIPQVATDHVEEIGNNAQILSADVVSGISNAQLALVVPSGPQEQLTTAVPSEPQEQLALVVPSVPQVQVAPNTPSQEQLATVVPSTVPQEQLAVVVPDKVISKVELNTDIDTPQNQLAAVMATMTAVNPQMDGNQLAKFAELQVQSQAQMQMPNQPILGQAQVAEVATKNTDMLLSNSTLSKITPSSLLIGNANDLGKNSKKQIDGKTITTILVNAEGTEVTDLPEVVDKLDIKPVLASQVAVAVHDTLTSENKQNIDAVLSNPLTKNADVFPSMLNQQGMTIANQTTVEVKQGQPPQVSDSYNISSQIVDQARLMTNAKNTEMIIQLKPEHLGELTFKVSVENGIVSASFHSNNPEVRSMIESSLYQLKQELSNQGLKIDNVGVYAGLGQFFSNGQQSEGYQQPTIKVQNKKAEEDFLQVLETTDSAGKVLNATGVDYRA